MTEPEWHGTGVSAHWGPKYGKRCLLDVTENGDGSITGIVPASAPTIGSAEVPPRRITLPARVVREKRIRLLRKG